MYGRDCWDMASDWNSLWVPHPDTSLTTYAVEVDVYKPSHASFSFYPAADRSGYVTWTSGVSMAMTKSDKSNFSLSSISTGNFYDNPAFYSADAWVTLRGEVYESEGYVSLYIDKDFVGDFDVDASDLSPDWIEMNGNGDCCDVSPNVCWSDLRVYSEAGL
jgi:hypothetical protein